MMDLLEIGTYFPLLHLLWQFTLLIVLFDMGHRRRSPASMIAWFLVIFAIPYVGVFFYLLMGRRKLDDTPYKEDFSSANEQAGSHNASEALLFRSGIPAATSGNRVHFYHDGTSAYLGVMDAITKAAESIHIATFIMKKDPVTRPLLELLRQKAREGVDVRLLIDAFGSLPLYLFPGRLRACTNDGVKIAFFMPLRPFWRNVHFNLRLHRKMFLIDNRTLFSGGMNLSNDYFGTENSPARWKDMLFRIEGPAVEHYANIFASDWNFTDATSPLAPRPVRAEHTDPGTAVQIVPSGPDVASDALYDVLTDAFYNARRRIWIVTPYFIPDEAMMHALKTAKRKGVEVRLITPQKTDRFLFELGRSSYMRELHEQQCDIRLYRKRMLHAKAILIDHTIGIAGSLNLDQRSLFLNYEVVSVLYAEPMLLELERWINALLSETESFSPPEGIGRRSYENIGRIIAPQL